MKRLALVVLILGTFVPNFATSKPVYQTQADGIVLIITDEPCEFQETVAMPFKATWTQNGQTVNGCWLPRQDLKVVLFYFPSDKSVFAVGMDRFKPLVNA